MITCKKCGVELPENANYCPLCGEPVRGKESKVIESLNISEHSKKNLEEFKSLTVFQRLKIFWQIVSFILLSAVLITTIIDLFYNNMITWSKYSTSVAVLLFINVSIFVFLNEKILLKHFLSFIALSGFILVLDIFDKSLASATKYVIPLMFIGYIIVLAFFFIAQKIKSEVFKLIAYSLITAGLVNIIIDAIIKVYVTGKISLSWSLIVCVSSFLISLLSFYFNHRIKKVSDLKRFFHL